MKMFVWLIYILLAVIGLWYIYVWVYYKYLQKIPGPTPWPLVGNVPHIGLRPTDFFPSLTKLNQKYKGGVIKIMLGTKPTLVITDHETMRFFLTSTTILKKSFAYNYLIKWLGSGLITSTGNKWRMRRKMITPAYHYQILEKYVDVFNTVTDTLLEVLEDEVGKERFNICEITNAYALDVVCEAAMGLPVKTLKNKNSEYLKASDEMCRIMLERGLNPLQQFEFTYKLTKNYRTEKKCLEILHNYSNSVIKQRREDLENGNKNNLTNQKRKVAFLDLLLQTKSDFLSDEDIREEVDTFMFAGHDTTSTAIDFCLFNLAKYQQVQQKVLEEQLELVGNDVSIHLTSKVLQEMIYLDAVVKENLRLYPSVPLIARELDQDVYYDKLDVNLPSGLTILMSLYGIQRDPIFFNNPDEFQPERFLKKLQLKKHYSYIPFSAGSRNCIGQKFAMLEIKCALSKIVRRFKILPVEPVHELKLSAEGVLRSSNGVPIRLQFR